MTHDISGAFTPSDFIVRFSIMLLFDKFVKIRLSRHRSCVFSILSKNTTYTIYIIVAVALWGMTPSVFSQQYSSTAQNFGGNSGDSLFREMLYTVESCVQISTSIRQQISLFGLEQNGTGYYCEVKETDPRQFGLNSSDVQFRLELNMPSANEDNSTNIAQNTLLIVCDKESLWRHTTINGENKLEKIELQPFLDAIKRSGRPDIPIKMNEIYGLGGMGGMLRELQRKYDFQADVEDVQISEKRETFVATKISGKLKTDELEKLTVDSKGKKTSVPVQIPTHLEIYVRSNNFFPYRIDYFRSKDGSEQNKRPFSRTEYYETKLNAGDIGPEMFIYRPDITSTDVIQKSIERLLGPVTVTP
jgi:hypothetical protein